MSPLEQFLIIFTVSVIIIFSPLISKMTHISVVVIEIFLGMLAGFFGLLYSDPNFALVSKFGFLYLMFLAGLEINFQQVKAIRQKLALNVVAYLLIRYVIAGIVCLFFELNIAYFIALPIFSLGMVMMLIKEFGKEEPWLNLALAVGILGEIVSIMILTVFSGWLAFGFTVEFFLSIVTILAVSGTILVLLKLFTIFFWWFPEFKKYIIPDHDRLDQDIRFSLSLFFIMVAVMLYFKIDVVLGAFTAGLFLKLYFHHKEELIEKLSSFGFGFFVPIFFIYIGTTIKLEMLSLDILSDAFFIIAVMISIRLIAAFFTFTRYLKTKQTILFALSDSMPLTFMVVIAILAFEHQMISQEEYVSFIIASMLDGLLLMVLIRKLYGWFGLMRQSQLPTPH